MTSLFKPGHEEEGLYYLQALTVCHHIMNGEGEKAKKALREMGIENANRFKRDADRITTQEEEKS